MSLLSTFISTQLIQAVEHEFINHTPEVQSVIIDEIKNFLEQGSSWVQSKINDQSIKEQPK